MSLLATVRRGWGVQLVPLARLRRALVWLAAVACAGAVLLYWRQQTDDEDTRPLQQHYQNHQPIWSWICQNQRCERLQAQEAPILQSLQTCNMLCDSTQLWPQPTGPISLGLTAVPLRLDNVHLQVVHSSSKEVTEHLQDAFALMKDDLRALETSGRHNRIVQRSGRETSFELTLRVIVNGSADPRMLLRTDESYKLAVHVTGDAALTADVIAHSFCGARHGFETLSQLVWYDPYHDSLFTLRTASVADAPKFAYRGLLLDTARNFFPVSQLLRTIDAMAACKLNTFHWHATDSQAFPLALKSVPQLAAQGAYGPRAVYSHADVRSVVQHARRRGVRVLLELDAPAHVGRAWAWGPAAGLGHLAHCVDAEPWPAYCGEPPCGQLNPRNPNVYRLLEDIYREILSLTGVDDLFHLGGDEVSENCWQLHFNDTDPMELWMEFTQRALDALRRANGGRDPELTLLWSSPLTRSPYLERLDGRRVGVQVWGASGWEESRAVLDAGYRAVLSHVDAWYLDCGFGSWRDSSDSHCGQYRSWQQVYEHRPWADERRYAAASESLSSPELAAEARVRAAGRGAAPGTAGESRWAVEGGAACQWSEQLGAGGLDTRVWPRAAALAERLWADGPGGAGAGVYLRLDTWVARAQARGVRAAPLWPRWCSHNPHACLAPAPAPDFAARPPI